MFVSKCTSPSPKPSLFLSGMNFAVNMRAAYQFRLFRGFPATTDTPLDEDMKPIPSTKMRLAVSPVVEFHNYNEPTQVHLSLTSDPSEISVLFVTKDLVDSVVEFGRAIDNLDSIAVATVTTYQLKHMCDAPANTSVGWRDPGHIHSAVMTELEPGVRYFYKVNHMFLLQFHHHCFWHCKGDFRRCYSISPL